jgi:hypothetical protein
MIGSGCFLQGDMQKPLIVGIPQVCFHNGFMRRVWPFGLVAFGAFIMLCGFVYYAVFAGMRFEAPKSEVPASIAAQAHIASVISWCGAAFFLAGLVASFMRLIPFAKLTDASGKMKMLRITGIAAALAVVATILCFISVMSGGFIIFSPLAVVSAWAVEVPLSIQEHLTHIARTSSLGAMTGPVFIQFFALIWLFTWFVAHRYGRQNVHYGEGAL